METRTKLKFQPIASHVAAVCGGPPPDFAMRWKSKPNDMAIWDNRSTQHCAAHDYTTQRIMQRVVTEGEVPVPVR